MVASGAMTRDDLVEQMIVEGLPLDMLCLRASAVSECYVVREGPGGWETFYAERGLETGLATFPTEDAACRSLLEQMRRR